MTDDERGYNGWRNYKTWAVALWLGDDQYTYNYWQSRAIEAYKEAEAGFFSRAEIAAEQIGEQLKEEIEEFNPLSGKNNLYSDLLGAALSEVDYYEIGEHYVYDIKDEVEEEERKENEKEGNDDT